jgi:hypothetical protein
MLILAAQSHSACRAVHFWLISSLREHQGAFRARIRKSSILTEMGNRVFETPLHRLPWISGIPRTRGFQGSLYLSRDRALETDKNTSLLAKYSAVQYKWLSGSSGSPQIHWRPHISHVHTNVGLLHPSVITNKCGATIFEIYYIYIYAYIDVHTLGILRLHNCLSAAYGVGSASVALLLWNMNETNIQTLEHKKHHIKLPPSITHCIACICHTDQSPQGLS